jgi:hypothetical protein
MTRDDRLIVIGAFGIVTAAIFRAYGSAPERWFTNIMFAVAGLTIVFGVSRRVVQRRLP